VENCNTIDRAEDVIEQHVSLHGVRLVAVDYLQLLGSLGANRYEEVSTISRRLKQVTKRTNVAMLAICQLNREVDKREDHNPRLSDLRDAGQLEQDADVIIFVQWPCKYSPMNPPENYRIFVAKRRNGPIRESRVETTFTADRQRIGALERDYPECPVPPTLPFQATPTNDDFDDRF
jgi:replicative DNA helicase